MKKRGLDNMLVAAVCFWIAAALALFFLVSCSSSSSVTRRADLPNPDITLMEGCMFNAKEQSYACTIDAMEEGLRQSSELWKVCAQALAKLEHCKKHGKIDAAEKRNLRSQVKTWKTVAVIAPIGAVAVGILTGLVL